MGEITANHTTSVTDLGGRPLSAKIREQVQAVSEFARSSNAKCRGAATNVLIVGPDAKERMKVALALAREQSAELFRVDLSAITSEFIDNIERSLDDVFSRAERDGAVLLFDEADVIFGRRRRDRIELRSFPQRLSTYRGLVVWAVRTPSHHRQAEGVPLDAIVNLRQDVSSCGDQVG